MRRATVRKRLDPVCAVLALAALAGPLGAHETGAPFSGAIIDPLVLHHAHIEDEQRINFFALRGVAGFSELASSFIATRPCAAWQRLGPCSPPSIITSTGSTRLRALR